MLFNRKPKGRIDHPGNRDLVPRRFRAEGIIYCLPAVQHLLLVVEIGGLKWPKGSVQVNDNTWTCDVFEGGTPPNGGFVLSLYAVGGEEFGAINAWLERGKATGDFPGLSHIKDGIRLDRVKLRLKP